VELVAICDIIKFSKTLRFSERDQAVTASSFSTQS